MATSETLPSKFVPRSRKVRILATLGPASASRDMIRKLAEAVIPVIPASAEKLIKAIDDGLSGGLAQPVPIFPRLELAQEEGAE